MQASPMKHLFVATAIAVGAASACAQTTVKDAWARGTVPQQRATGVFAQITSAAGGRLVEARSPAAARTEIHTMVLDGNVARMRQIAGLDLPAGKPVELRPGGYHIMLIDLKQQLAPGDSVPLTLVIEAAGGRRETVELSVPVKPLSAGAMPAR